MWALAYVGSGGYASNYAMGGPWEDFAESFAAYFTQKAGRAWYSPGDGPGPAGIPDKLTVLGWWISTL